MERVAQRSFRYNDEFSTEFGMFFSEVCREFNLLNQLKIDSAQPFEAALIQLVTGWGRQDRDEEARRGEAVHAVRFAELRQAEAEQIARDLGQRPDLDSVPAVIQDFLFGPWALVLAHARLTDTARQVDPKGYQSVISDLLWSVKRDVTLRRPAQLFERVPPLLAKLREGLASLGQDPAEHEGVSSGTDEAAPSGAPTAAREIAARRPRVRGGAPDGNRCAGSLAAGARGESNCAGPALDEPARAGRRRIRGNAADRHGRADRRAEPAILAGADRGAGARDARRCKCRHRCPGPGRRSIHPLATARRRLGRPVLQARLAPGAADLGRLAGAPCSCSSVMAGARIR